MGGELIQGEDGPTPSGKRSKLSDTSSIDEDEETNLKIWQTCHINQKLWDRAKVEFKTAGMPDYHCGNCKEFYEKEMDVQCDIEGCNINTRCPSCLQKCWVCGLG